MSKVIFVDNDIPQTYSDFTGWYWWDSELEQWSKNKEKYWEQVGDCEK